MIAELTVPNCEYVGTAISEHLGAVGAGHRASNSDNGEALEWHHLSEPRLPGGYSR